MKRGARIDADISVLNDVTRQLDSLVRETGAANLPSPGASITLTGQSSASGSPLSRLCEALRLPSSRIETARRTALRRRRRYRLLETVARIFGLSALGEHR